MTPADDPLLSQGTVDERNEARNPLNAVPLFQTPPKLTERQQWVYDELGYGPAKALEVGAMLHRWQSCRYCTPLQPCQYAESSGREILEALRKKGLLRRDRHHVYRRVDLPAEPVPDEPVDWGGF